MKYSILVLVGLVVFSAAAWAAPGEGSVWQETDIHCAHESDQDNLDSGRIYFHQSGRPHCFKV